MLKKERLTNTEYPFPYFTESERSRSLTVGSITAHDTFDLLSLAINLITDRLVTGIDYFHTSLEWAQRTVRLNYIVHLLSLYILHPAMTTPYIASISCPTPSA